MFYTLHCKACDSPVETDSEYLCPKCLGVALNLIPKDLIELEVAATKIEDKKETECLPLAA